jgi:hypothetical protein
MWRAAISPRGASVIARPWATLAARPRAAIVKIVVAHITSTRVKPRRAAQETAGAFKELSFVEAAERFWFTP